MTNDSCELAHRLSLQLAKKIGFLDSNSETHSILEEGKGDSIHCLPPIKLQMIKKTQICKVILSEDHKTLNGAFLMYILRLNT